MLQRFALSSAAARLVCPSTSVLEPASKRALVYAERRIACPRLRPVPL